MKLKELLLINYYVICDYIHQLIAHKVLGNIHNNIIIPIENLNSFNSVLQAKINIFLLQLLDLELPLLHTYPIMIIIHLL